MTKRDDAPPGSRSRDPSDWRRVDAVFSELLDTPAHQRAALLAERCGSDAELRAAVQRLLEAEQRSAEMFAAALPTLNLIVDEALANQLHEEEPPPEALRKLGPYRLTRRIGSGGMSVVWLAERADGEFRQTVAIKLLRRWMEGDDALHRFRAERQILSTLAHPGM